MFFVVVMVSSGVLLLLVGLFLLYKCWSSIFGTGWRVHSKQVPEPTIGVEIHDVASLPRDRQQEQEQNSTISDDIIKEDLQDHQPKTAQVKPCTNHGSPADWNNSTFLANVEEIPTGLTASTSGRETLLRLESSRLRSFGYEELAKSTGSFSNSNLLGEGGFGQVYKGTFPDGAVFAIKKLKYNEAGTREAEFEAEMLTITRIHHRNLVKLVGYCIDETNRLLVYEFVLNNSLRSHLHGGKDALSWANRLKIAIGSAIGLEYLHQGCDPKIIHRDIKADNILVDENFEPKITDFGLAKDISYSHSHISTDTKGTFGYLAPEYDKDKRLTDKSDVFSFGVVLLELLTGKKHASIDRVGKLNALAVSVVPGIKETMAKGTCEALLDPKLVEAGYNLLQVTRMIYCAAACVYKPAKHRPDIRKVVEVLKGNMALEQIWVHSDIKYLYSGAPYEPFPAGNHSQRQHPDEGYFYELKRSSI